MSNVIPFPSASPDGTAVHASHHVGATFLLEPGAHSHAVQFYEGDAFLADTVARFLGAGLEVGDRIVVIATPEHRAAFAERLTAGSQGASSGITFLDAREMLAIFMVDGMPDPDLFRAAIDRVMNSLKGSGARPAKIRAYGEMVDLLWRDGDSSAAIRLEELWNDAGKAHAFSLLCAYAMGNFYKEGDESRFLEVCRNHSHVLPTESFSQVDDASVRLREISLLQHRARRLEHELSHRKELESTLRDALRERAHVEEQLRVSLEAERRARELAEANDAFKEVFVGILGHDLRNPLNSLLTTARTMEMRGDLSSENEARVRRIASSGARMQRMITQLLDMTRARLASGISVEPVVHELGPLVVKIVDELRASHPSRVFELRIECPCRATIDPDRLEQVVSNLVGNAIAHSDPDSPILVELVGRGAVTHLVVHNHGPVIPAATFSRLFDPFRRGQRHGGRSEGLGLGLYITDRIIAAHGGRIEVSSSPADGTRFEVFLPSHG